MNSARSTSVGRAATFLLLVLTSVPFACSEAAAPDEASLASLSERELLGVCDELRDPVTRFKRPLDCGEGATVRLVAPSNSSCRLAMLSGCAATVGDVRACSAAVLADPCAAAEQPPAACERLADCDSSLIASAVYEDCTPSGFEELSRLQGVYVLLSHGLNDSCRPPGSEADTANQAPRLSSSALPEVPAQGYLVLQAIDLAPVPELLSSWCDDLATCQALLAGDALEDPSTVRPGERLTGCFGPGSFPAARSPRPEDPCEVPTRSTTLTRVSPGTAVLETITRAVPGPRDPRGCGFIISEPEAYSPPCQTVEVYRLEYQFER